MSSVTMTITARDESAGLLGIAVATCAVAGGVRILHATSGLGVVTAQAESNLWYGDAALSLLGAGMTAPEALAAVITHGAARQRAQLAILDVHGRIAVHTG